MDLAEHPFFVNLPEKDRNSLISVASVHRVPPETVIFDEGSSCDGLYLVLDGTVAISRRQPDGTRRFVNYAKPGVCFGEMAIIMGRTRSARATAISDCVYGVIPVGAIRPVIESGSSILVALVRIIAGHLTTTTDNYIRDIAQQENLAMLGTLVNSVLHDFKNPLMLVTLNSQLIAQEHPDPRTQVLCRTIEAQVERMSAMSMEIGEFSKSGERTVFSKVNLQELAKTFHFLNAALFEQGTPSIEIDIPPIELEAEPKKLLRVLQNIIGNAVEALSSTPAGKVTIKGSLSPEGQSVLLSISDNGPGIPPAVQKRLWEPFFTHGKAGGTGLGLSIAKAFIDAHNGSVQCISSPEKGTTFNILLPLKQTTAHVEGGRNLLNAFLASRSLQNKG
ncbi:MAG: cyclic nucleotide-binding domain-containing protein [Puniceicoccales bacterium]|jgi:signal transduction histidine kinase|nr:cyclic nucleotide-binding domain-containing protein [Puniceicoccales bacterium]